MSRDSRRARTASQLSLFGATMGIVSTTTWLLLLKAVKGRELQRTLEMGWRAASQGRLNTYISALTSIPFLWTIWAITFLMLSATSLFYHSDPPDWSLLTMSPLVVRPALTALVLFAAVSQVSLFAMYGQCVVAMQSH